MTCNQNQNDALGKVFCTSWENILLLCVALPCLAFNILGSVGSVWYLRCFIDRRTLMRKLMENVSWTGLEYLTFVHLIDILRYIFEPIHSGICFFHVIVKNTVNIQFALYLAAINILRYRMAFRCNTISQSQESFWHFFLNLLIVSFSFFTQALFIFFPGKQPLSFYICCGQKPSSLIEPLKTKVNILGIGVQLVCISIHLFVTVKMTLSQFQLERNSITCIAFFLRSLKKSILVITLGINLIAFICIISKANSLKMSEVIEYPNYYFIHVMMLIFPIFATTTMTIVFYFKNQEMFDAVKDPIKI